MKNKKIIIPIIIVTIILISTLLIFKIRGKSINTSNNELNLEKSTKMFDPEELIIIDKNGKKGFINSKGKRILEPQYENVTRFYGNYAKVEKEDGTYAVINKKGEELHKSEYEIGIKHIDVYDIWIIDDILYDSNLKQLTTKDVMVRYLGRGYLSYSNYDQKNYGIMNSEGKTTYKYKGSEEGSFDATIEEKNVINNEVYAIIHIEENNVEKHGIINCKTGKLVLDFMENDIYEESNNIFRIYKKDENVTLYQIYIEDDKIAYKIEGDKIDLEFYDKTNKILGIDYKNEDREEYYSLIDKQKYEYSNLEQAIKIEKNYIIEEIENFEYKIYKENKKYGILLKDEVYLEPQYTKIEFLPYTIYLYMQEKEKKNIVLLNKDSDTTVVYDLIKKQELFTFNLGKVQTNLLSSYIYAKDNNKMVVYNLISGKSKEFSKDAKINCSSNYITIINKDSDKKIYYNTDFEEIYRE